MATFTWLEKKHGLVSDLALNRLLTRINRRIVAGIYGTALERELLDIPKDKHGNDYPWQIFVIDTDQPNAFSPGAGLIILTKGMIIHSDSEAELAAVISHEIAHQLLGHTRKLHSDLKHWAAKRGADQPRTAFSLEQELAADALGIKLMRVARYDLEQALNTLMIPYRPFDGVVSQVPRRVPPKWLSARMTQMHRLVEKYRDSLPATKSSREFDRVKSHL